MWTCSGCEVMIRPWFDNIASISSSVEADGIDEKRMNVGFSPVTRRLRSLKT
jgi:hypothetical protein